MLFFSFSWFYSFLYSGSYACLKDSKPAFDAQYSVVKFYAKQQTFGRIQIKGKVCNRKGYLQPTLYLFLLVEIKSNTKSNDTSRIIFKC